MGDNLKAGNPVGERERGGGVREAQTVFPVAQIKTRGNNVVKKRREDESSLLRGYTVCGQSSFMRPD